MVSQGVRHTEEGENVHAFIWLDNAQVLGLTTIHDIPTSIENYTVCNRKKPYNTHKVVKAVFSEHPRMLLPIPDIINDYNNYMNAVDRADQLRSEMSTHIIGFWVWLPLFYWLLDCAKVNAYILFKLHYKETVESGAIPTRKPLSHRQFQQEIAVSMILEGYGKMMGHTSPAESTVDNFVIVNIKPKKLREFKLPPSRITLPLERFNLSLPHDPVRIPKRPYCVWC